ncbi:hypothetical protein [Paenibacillus glycanilyticus]|uniref:DUF4825 domain-containing protein n=1 Tax=Paenibacillus glycanilyticus TaxID=126569 RepID=A0ABQ6GI68_9BACL|nr:hypothetical protein [Paenibacillus glycanilyticus]GLX69332.1 hypothetical protein MU1_36770 [Paenibacillus glycanilyticus]
MRKSFFIFLIFLFLVACSQEHKSNEQSGTVDGILTHVYNNQKYKFTKETVNKSDIGNEIGNLDNGNGPEAFEIKGFSPKKAFAVEDGNGGYLKMVPITTPDD